MQTKLQYPEWGGQREILYCTHLLIALGEIREPVLTTHITSPRIFHNSGNCHQESQFLTYMTCLLALSIELETHNYSIWGKRFKISIFFRINKRQWKNRLWTLTVESKTDVCIHYRAVYCVYRDPSTPVAGILHYYSWLLLTIHPSLPPPPELSTGIHEISLCPENALLLTRT